MNLDLSVLGDVDEVVDRHPSLAILVQPIGILGLQDVVKACADHCYRLLSGAQHINCVSHRVRLCLDDGLVFQGRERRQEGCTRHKKGVDKQRLADIEHLQYVFFGDGIDGFQIPVDSADEAVSDRVQQEL
ncbi:hypothetical protein C8A03DRAFT_13215 [Achaetomium macrosporum]|uniref:Uncharacterized protein n=1 Tax=Achaetomium macrosporum TaxID=79813 RepID=A0AAN7CG66_9PEZI|nr:hypothetical protein C8A03DRAFT_13215 [Achaetomium macrosporum]